MSQFAHRVVGDVHIAALDRLDGVSQGNFSSFNVANYVGDDPEQVASNVESAASFVSAKGVAIMSASHSNVVHVVSDPGVALPGDGLVTDVPGLALLALSADCLTGAVIDQASNRIGVFHAGWKGILSNVAAATIRTMLDAGSGAEHLHVVFGSRICGDCYEVPTERVDQFRDVCPQAIRDRTHLDLAAGARAQVEVLGVSHESIGACTFENDNFFSYRRANGQPTGRGGLIVARAGER